MKTIQTTINGVPVLLVSDIEARYYDIKVSGLNFLCGRVHHDTPLFDGNYLPIYDKPLPSPPTGYTWRFINLTKDVTEEQARELMPSNVDMPDVWYLDFINTGSHGFKNSALESFVSFLQKHGVIDRIDVRNGVMAHHESQSRLSTWGLIAGEKGGKIE